MNKKIRWITETALLLSLLADKASRNIGKQATAWLLAAVGKFAALYLIVVKLLCGVMAPGLLAAGTMKEPMVKALSDTFSWPQLVTALLMVPVLKKALHR